MKQVNSVELAAVAQFQVGDFFREGHHPNGISLCLGDIFEQLFLERNFLEKDIPSVKLNGYTVEGNLSNGQVLERYLDEKTSVTSLAHIAELITRQPEGEKGLLQTHQKMNYFFVKDTKENVWSLGCVYYPRRGQWAIEATISSVTFSADRLIIVP